MSSCGNAKKGANELTRGQVRAMISRVYVGVFNAPPPSKWGKRYERNGLVAAIRNMLKIPVGSTAIVCETMLATWWSLKKDEAIDFSR